MPAANNFPGDSIEDFPSSIRTVPGVATSIAAFIGWAPQGPTDQAQRVLSWSEFSAHFGGLDSRSLLGYAVSHFFMNGGREAYIVRLVSSDAAAAATSIPPPADTPSVGLSASNSSPPLMGGTSETVLHPNSIAFEAAIGTPGNPSTGALGLLDQIDLFNLLCVPGETNSATLSVLEKYCKSRRVFLIADSDPTVTDFNTLAGGPGFAGANAAFYFPWLLAPDPLKQNAIQQFPPCGFVAGIYARTDIAGGVWKAPAGTEAAVAGVSGTAVLLNDQAIGVLNPVGVNCIRSLPVVGTVLWGDRTIDGIDKSGSDWKYIPIRRLALYVEGSLFRGIQWALFEPNDETLWAQIRLSVRSFMQTLYRQGAFQGSTPKDAYYVRCDSTTTTAIDVTNGIVNIEVGFAPLRPAEFVIIRIQQMAGRQI